MEVSPPLRNPEKNLPAIDLFLANTDSIDWIEVSVPSSMHIRTLHPNHVIGDFASCCSVGNPPSYFVWKTCQSRPNMLDIFKLGGHKEKSKNGLRLVFPDVLFQFAFIYEDESFSAGNRYMLYAVTLSGVAYLIRLRNSFDYPHSSCLMTDEFLEQNTEINPHNGDITAVAATKGCLIIGRSGGSVHCFQLGSLDPSAPGFVSEFRDDAGFGRLGGILSRSPTLAGVADLAISEVQNRLLAFVLHSDGYFRIWDLSTSSESFAHAISMAAPEGSSLRLWVGEADNDTGIVPLAIGTWQLDAGMDILLYSLHCKPGDRIPFSLDDSYEKIPLGVGGRPIDVRLASHKLWLINEEGLLVHDIKQGSAHHYNLREAYIADLLFQSSDNCLDDLLWLALSAFSSSKEEVAPFVSSIFLRSLLFHCNVALRPADYNKHFTDSEFGSFTVDGLTNEVFSLNENQSQFLPKKEILPEEEDSLSKLKLVDGSESERREGKERPKEEICETSPKADEDTRMIYEWSDEELLNSFFDYLRMPYDRVEIAQNTLPVIRKYLQEVEESEGFDIEHFPGFIMGITSMCPSKYLSGGLDPSMEVKENLACWAIEEYNENNGTKYDDVQVEKVNVSVSNYCFYYITFSAVDTTTGERKTFQAEVSQNMIRDDADPEVEFCRLKATS